MDTHTLLVIVTAALVLGLVIALLMQSHRIGWLEDAAKAQDKESKRLDEVRNMALKDISRLDKRIDNIRDNQIAETEVMSERIDCERKRIGDQVERVSKLTTSTGEMETDLREQISRLDKRADSDAEKLGLHRKSVAERFGGVFERLNGLEDWKELVGNPVEENGSLMALSGRIDDALTLMSADRSDSIECDKDLRAWRDGVDSKLGALNQDHLTNLDTQCRDLRKSEATFKELFQEQKQANLHLQERLDSIDGGAYTIGSDKPLKQDVKPQFAKAFTMGELKQDAESLGTLSKAEAEAYDEPDRLPTLREYLRDMVSGTMSREDFIRLPAMLTLGGFNARRDAKEAGGILRSFGFEPKRKKINGREERVWVR